MIQSFTLLVALSAAAFLILPACETAPPCPELAGRWTTREGQDFVFQPDSQALWLTRFGSLYDTVRLIYRLNCAQQPPALDLKKFQSGPYVGKTLFGILEWQSDTSFRLRYEPGEQPGARPRAFDPEQTLKFFRAE